MYRFSTLFEPLRQRQVWIFSALLLGVAGLLQSASYGQGSTPELLGANKKTVSRILGDGQPLVSGLFNEESSESHSGGIGSTHGYRTRIGYLDGRSCYAFFMKKSGENFNAVEAIGLLYLCANRAEWRDVGGGFSESVFLYQAKNDKGKVTGRTYIATLDESTRRLFVYSPQWRPDFNQELWITPDEAPVHREARELPRRPSSKQTNSPEASGELFGKSGGIFYPQQAASNPKQTWVDPKQAAHSPKQTWVDPKQAAHSPKQTWVDPKQAAHSPKQTWVDPKQAAHSPKQTWVDPKQAAHSPKQTWVDPKQPAHDPKHTWVDPKQAAPHPKNNRVLIDPKQGIYVPNLNQVVPADTTEETKPKKRGKRKRRQGQRTEPKTQAPGK